MNWSKNASFADRLSAAAEAKKAQLERAAQARSEAESPTAIKRRMARDAVKVARDARIAERRATKLAVEARQAAALAAAQAAEVAAREAALKAEQAARDANFGVSDRRFRFKPAGGFGGNRQAVSVQNGTPLRMGFGPGFGEPPLRDTSYLALACQSKYSCNYYSF